MDPCKELETRGGIWRYDAKKTDQTFSPAERYATGIRNGEGFAIDAAGHDLRDPAWARPTSRELARHLQAGPGGYTASEEVMLLKQGGDYGWPECYYDPL